VSFELKGQIVQGVLSRLNPKRAHVLCDDDEEYQVPYGLLTVISTTQNGNRNATELNGITELARKLMVRHQLSHWSFQFDHGTQRAGCCHYKTQVISVSIAYAKHCSEAEIKDTILHEIAHALVGKAHNHDAVWKAKAVEIGCSGLRCHDVQFTPPRYIVKCKNNCWVATAEQKERGEAVFVKNVVGISFILLILRNGGMLRGGRQRRVRPTHLIIQSVYSPNPLY